MESKLRAVLPDHDLLKLYEQMVLCREFEESCAEQYTKGHITGFLHLYSGQEAVAVGATAGLHRDDFITSAYREHPQAIVRGAEPRRVMAELFGKATGICKGKGGSMHLFDPNLSFMGGYAIVGGQFPIACGLAFAAKFRNEDRISRLFLRRRGGQPGELPRGAQLGAALGTAGALHLREQLLRDRHRGAPLLGPGQHSQADLRLRHPLGEGGRDGCDRRLRGGQACRRVGKGAWPALPDRGGHLPLPRPLHGRSGEIPERWPKWSSGRPATRSSTFPKRLIEEGVADEDQLECLKAKARVIVKEAVEFAEQSPWPDDSEVTADIFVGEQEVCPWQ